ncbi:MAG TPA: hypothetical protein VFB76_11050 [Candidatus Angelobacter sp.]|nr:hypothetical protein [Candidatus Angelobacter sp.]
MNSKIRNDAEAQELLAKLEDYYHQPVLPLRSFCKAIQTWMDCVTKNNIDPDLARNDFESGHDYYEYLGQISIDIKKSNLLGRLLYAKEPLRTRMCPKHKGHWDGKAMFFEQCPHDCGGTGWLKERSSDSSYTGMSITLVDNNTVRKALKSKAKTRKPN